MARMDQEQLCPVEQPSWSSGTSSVTPTSEFGFTTSEKMHLSLTGPDVNHREQCRPKTQEQDHREAPTDTVTRPEPEQSSSHEQTQEKLPEAAKQDQDQAPRRPKKKYNCPTCERAFPHNTALQRHLVIHSGKRPFKCFICGRGFTQSGNLKTHMKVHRGELPHWTLIQEKSPTKESPVTVHVCGECGMDFPQKQQLEEHRQSHKKPYACPDCGKTFKNEYYFKIHKRVHSGESPFLCSECGKSCVTADLLKKHKLTHSGEKNFHCDQCGRAFSQSSNLKVHLQTHTGERPHLCSICGYQAHLKIHDKKPKPPRRPLGRPKQQLLVVNNQ
uniref:zinc finger protein 239-like isoform X2 n=1 Tax=Scatophagus argus TaxID=75038 RepID=UPI001ED7E5F3|nr:zinc finger protein 239-like isoform X2 [Scatophagus argus]